MPFTWKLTPSGWMMEGDEGFEQVTGQLWEWTGVQYNVTDQVCSEVVNEPPPNDVVPIYYQDEYVIGMEESTVDEVDSMDDEDGDSSDFAVVDGMIVMETPGGTGFQMPVFGVGGITSWAQLARSGSSLAVFSPSIINALRPALSAAGGITLMGLLGSALRFVTLLQIGDLLGDLFPSLFAGDDSHRERKGVYYRNRLVAVCAGDVHLVHPRMSYVRNLNYQAGRLETIR